MVSLITDVNPASNLLIERAWFNLLSRNFNENRFNENCYHRNLSTKINGIWGIL